MKREYWRYLPFVWPYALRHKPYLLSSLLLMLMGAGVALLEPLPLAFLVDSVFGHHAAPHAVTQLVGDTPSRLIVFAVGASLLVVLLVNAIGLADAYVNTRLEQHIALDLRYDLFSHCLRLSRAFHDVTSPGDYIYRINYEAHSAGAITVAFPPLIQSVLTLVGMFVITYHLSPALALLSLTVVPFIYWSTGVYGKVIEPRLIQARSIEGESLSIVNQTMQFLRTIITFNRQPFELDRFLRQGQRAVAMRIRVTVMQTLFNLGVAIITAGGTALIIGVGAHEVLDGQLSIGQLLIVLSYVAAIYKPLQTISSTMALFQEQLIGIRFGIMMLQMPPEVVDAPDAQTVTHVDGRLDLEGVTFHYETREETLCDISFTVEAGQSVAIVGPTGAGKSTLVSLIPRLFDPHEGRILLDGRDLRTLTQRSLRDHISLVSQEAQLFSGTVAENIRYGRLDATDDEVVAAARAANAHDFIMDLPEQYQTQLGDQGARLSGGERQRLCIARAFLKDAPVLILDEPTSAIDSRTESVILQALERLAEGRTTITIAHRLSTIRNVDRIVVLDRGRVAEQGTHDELLAQGGLYATLHAMQSGAQQPAEQRALPPAPHQLALAAAVPRQRGPLALASPSALALTAAPGLRRRPKVVVLGLMAKMPFSGVVWQTVQYLVGLERLGCDVYYVEAHAVSPAMFMNPGDPSGSRSAAEFLDRTMTRFGFGHRWAFQALHDAGQSYGLPKEEVLRLYREADLVVNLHGGTHPPPEEAAGRLLYLETDPVQVEVEADEGDPEALAFLRAHDLFATYGENLGSDRSPLPLPAGLEFLPTRPPVVLDFWSGAAPGPADTFTTIGNLRQVGNEVWWRGECYHWSKHLELLPLLKLPGRVGSPVELALGRFGDDDRALLERYGWAVRDAAWLSQDPDAYRQYVRGSRAELTVAKDQNVRLRTGWFSDRSATYLASGRPVVTQDTGFGDVLPTGLGLLAFSSLDEAVAAVQEVDGSYRRHRRGAREVAEEFFAHDRVLPPLLHAAGIATPRTAGLPVRTPQLPFPADLELLPVSRHPTLLPPRTAQLLDALPWPVPAAPPAGRPVASVVVVTYNGLPFTRLALEPLLGRPGGPPVEVVVVDNGSTDGTLDYLDHLQRACPAVLVLRNDANRGFAAAVNQGVAASTADAVVLLNNDTVVVPGWLDRLLAHLDDVGTGLVGACTNGAPNEARVEAGYTTYGGLLRFAEDWSRAHRGEVFDLPVATMFCLAARREVLDRLGPLDEQFWPGMFEDDDYAHRARAAGLRVVCARDVYVHHFGEAAFGELVPSGDHAEAFRANRSRFEAKWGGPWQPHRPPVSEEYRHLRGQVREVVEQVVPPGGSVLVVSRGDEELLAVGDRTVRHFPQTSDGGFAGWYPASDDDAIAQLERLRQSGAEYVVFPATSLWWLEHYRELRRHLETSFGEASGDAACRIYGPAR